LHSFKDLSLGWLWEWRRILQGCSHYFYFEDHEQDIVEKKERKFSFSSQGKET